MNALEGRFAARQIMGNREAQEDDFGLIEPSGTDTGGSVVLLLADGMGGHIGGDTASATVVRTFAETYHGTAGPKPDRLKTCLHAANRAIASSIEEDPTLEGMGSTVVAAVVSPEGIDWISVGDSPLWLFRNGELRRLNADHSMAPALEILVDQGHLTAEEAATDPKRHTLRSAVVGGEIHLVDVSSQPVALHEGDRVLLGSDGLFTLGEEVIAGIMEQKGEDSPAQIADDLIQAVEETRAPRQDNTTVLLYTPAIPRSGIAGASLGRRKMMWLTMAAATIALSLAGYWVAFKSAEDWQAIPGFLRVGGTVSDSTGTVRGRAIPEGESEALENAVPDPESETPENAVPLPESETQESMSPSK